MQITQFPSQLVEVGSREPVPDEQGNTNNADAQVTIQLGWGIRTGNPQSPILELQRYLTGLDPEVAITVGEAIAEAGRELAEKFPPPAKSDLMAATPAMAAEAARQAEAFGLTGNGH